MPARSLVLTGPVPLAGARLGGHLSALVSADVLVRRDRDDGRTLPWVAATMGGGLAAQRAAEDELAREGLDKVLLGREGFAARLGAMAGAARQQLASVVAGLGLEVDLDAAATRGEAVAAAARTAFVRLYDAGLVTEAERVVGVCPRCATTVAAADAVTVDVPGESLTLRLVLLDGPGDSRHVDVRCLAPELLPGVVAVAVPEGSPVSGASALVPLAATVVPVVVDASVGAPTLVVPAHDPAALAVARRLGLGPVAVVDAGGSVCAPGRLAGLARYAARAAARQLLAAERAVVAAEEQVEAVARCRACYTVLVPLLGRHWFLAAADLHTAAADAVRDGRLAVWPAGAREELLAGSGGGGEWCLDQQVWGGVPLPVGRCLDCDNVDVSVHPAVSCGNCMGHLVPADDVLDARFVRCVWPLAAAGWPEAGRAPGERPGGRSLLVVAADAVDEILRTVALGLRLSGGVPFDEVAVAPFAGAAPDPGSAAEPVDVGALVVQEGSRVVRVALAGGGLDVAAARGLVARLDDPPTGGADVDRLTQSMTDAFAAAAPAAALGLLAAAVGEGVPAAEAARVRALAGPFVGA